MNKTKIVFIGAGSLCFGTSTFRDIFSCRELAGSELYLVDIDAENLDRMYRLALAMNEHSDMKLKIKKTTDRRQALPGAEFIINSLAIERCDLWRHDFIIPKKYGVRHTLGENGGPGGLFFTLRTIPLLIQIARDIEQLCPDAYFINFSNPESRIILALSKYTSVKCVGLCHGVFMGQHSVSTILGRDPAAVEVFAAGLNHFQWLLKISDKATGEDLIPELIEREAQYDPSFSPLSRNLFRAFGFYPSCSDDHIGEYLPYGWQAGEDGYNFDTDAKGRIDLKNEIELKISRPALLDEWAPPSEERPVHIINGILNNKKWIVESGIMMNNGIISNLPAECAVEVPIFVDRSGITPFHVGKLPDNIARLLHIQASIQQAAVEAAVYGSKQLALQALLLDPVITSTDDAINILNELWEINKNYIHQCI